MAYPFVASPSAGTAAAHAHLSASQGSHDAPYSPIEALEYQRDRLLEKNQHLKARKQQLKCDLHGLRAAQDQLSSQNQELQAALDRAQTARDLLGEQLRRVTVDLEGIRAELGEFTPADVRSLAAERASLKSEVERLGAEIQILHDEQSAYARAADQLKRRDADLDAALAEIERFAGLLKDRDERLETARTDQHRWGVDRQTGAGRG